MLPQSGRKRAVVGITPVLVPGIVVAVLTVEYFGYPQPMIGRVVSLLALVFLAIPLIGGSYWLLLENYEVQEIRRVSAWSLIGTVPITVLAGVVVLFESVQGTTLSYPLLVLSWVAGVGAIGGFLTGVYDTRREQERHRLSEVSGRLAALIEAAPLAIVAVDVDAKVETWGGAATEMFGWEAEEVVGEEYPMVPDHKWSEFEHNRRRILDGQIVDGIETKRVRKDGTLFDVSVWAAPIREEGEVVGAMIAIADVTERIHRRQRLTVLKRVLRHNLRNAANVIGGNAATLLEGSEDPDVAAAAATIRGVADDLVTLSEKSRRAEQALRADDQAASVDVDAVLRRLGEEFDREYPEAEVIVDASGNHHVVDNGTLEVALREAFENALEHCDGERPTVRATTDEESSEDAVLVRVADHGPGIPDHEREVIETGTETDLRHGSSLGLWLMKWVVEELGGDLRIENRDSEGAVVTFEVPRVDPDVDVGARPVE